MSVQNHVAVIVEIFQYFSSATDVQSKILTWFLSKSFNVNAVFV